MTNPAPPDHYLIRLPAGTDTDTLEQAVQQAGGSLKWVVVNPTEFDAEYYLADAEIYEGVARHLSEHLTETLLPLLERQLNHLTPEGRRQLIQLAVTQWNYLGSQGPDPAAIQQDWNNGIILKILNGVPTQ